MQQGSCEVDVSTLEMQIVASALGDSPLGDELRKVMRQAGVTPEPRKMRIPKTLFNLVKDVDLDEGILKSRQALGFPDEYEDKAAAT